ncbi:MAG: PQQ-binding-like beta-propeller repeat protein, partial [Phycisphaerae bacterium]
MPGAPERAAEGHTDVYVNDSFEAADAATRAAALGRRGKWIEAAKLLQSVSDTAASKLSKAGPGYYVGVRESINRTIAAWPPEGLAAYRSLYSQRLRDELLAIGSHADLETLLALFGRYSCTDEAAGAADRIAQTAIEHGDLVLATHVYRRIVESHPDRARYARRYRAMLAVLAAMQGETVDLPPRIADAVVRWKGEDRTVREIMSAVGTDFAAVRGGASPSQWPIFAGDDARNRNATTKVKSPGLLWRLDLVIDAGAARVEDETEPERRRRQGRRLTMEPVVSEELVFVQRFREIAAVHRKTGAVAWRFQSSEDEAGEADVADEQIPGWDSVTVADGRVYAALPGNWTPFYSYEPSGRRADIVCLDAATGELIWRLDPAAVDEPFAETVFDSSPVVRQGRVFVVGRRRRSFGFEDCYLYCFDAQTGAFLRRTHLGGASTGSFGARRATKAVAALRGDRVYVCTNLGTIASVSAYTGLVLWLRLYGRGPQSDGDESSGDRGNGTIHPWHYNPVVLSGDRLIALPSDGDAVIVLSARTGRPLREIPTGRIGEARTLLGVRDAVACFSGAAVSCYDLEGGRVLWTRSLAEGDRVMGRGIWADDRLLVPSRRRLFSFAVVDGQRTEADWGAEGEGGNLLALPDQILVAGAGRLTAFVRKREIWQALRRRMNEAPEDPLPALELAEVAINNGAWSEALSVLGEAVRRADAAPGAVSDGPSGRVTGPGRPSVRSDRPNGTDPMAESSAAASSASAIARRIFDDALMFVDRLSRASVLDAEKIDRLLAYAAQYAPDPAAHLAYRFRFAALLDHRGEAGRAMRLYHQVLRDRSLRELRADRAGHGLVAIGSPTGGARARAAVASLIERFGRTVYAPYEAEAGEWLARARRVDDTAALRRVVATFPNSRAAPEALVLLGDLLSRDHRPRDAARTLARAYHRYGDQVDRAALLRKIADAYEQASMAAHAYRWLTKAAREHPSVRVKSQGRLVTFLEYRQRLASVRDRVEPSRPAIEPPLSAHHVRPTSTRSSLLVPRFGDNPSSNWSRYLVHTANGVEA